MIYVDTAVVIAHVLGEDRRPSPTLFDGVCVASRLVDIEAQVVIRRRFKGRKHNEVQPIIDRIVQVMERVTLVELTPEIAERAKLMEDVRSLDAIHLATALWLQRGGLAVELCTYDGDLEAAARKNGLPMRSLA